jgi:hypothetical protein
VSQEPSPANVVAVEIDDPALANRMASLLGGSPDSASLRRENRPQSRSCRAIFKAASNHTVSILRRENSTCSRRWRKAHRTRQLRSSSGFRYTPPNSTSARFSTSLMQPAAPTPWPTRRDAASLTCNERRPTGFPHQSALHLHSDIARFLRSPRRRSREARREDLRRARPFLRLGLVWA